MADDAQNRSQPATPRRLQKAREAGDVPISREFTGLLSLSLGVGGLLFCNAGLYERSVQTLRGILANSYSTDLTAAPVLVRALLVALMPGLPVIIGAGLGGVSATLLQTRGLIRAASLKPDLSRLNAARGFKRIVSLDGLIDLIKSLIKIILMFLVSAISLDLSIKYIINLVQLNGRELWSSLTFVLTLTIGIALSVQALVSVFDFLITRLRFRQRHRMSRQDLKEEYKETEGNPQSKMRIKRLQRSRRPQLVSEVSKATVIVTNPTHYAVALAYDRSSSEAPMLVAKGADFMARRIREIGRLNGVPIVERPEVARALFRLEVDTAIPPTLYKAVAEIIAFVWRLQGRQG